MRQPGHKPGQDAKNQWRDAHVMTVVIRETGERRTLSYPDPVTGVDWVEDLIVNSGAVGDYVDYDAAADVYVMGQDDYVWWDEYIRQALEDEDELYHLRRVHGDLVDRIVREEWDKISANDYDTHHLANRRAIERLRALRQDDEEEGR
jgi:hypothetical protein